MAKKQTRRSISVSRTTYERLKAFCETNNISMSQLVETRVNDFLGGDVAVLPPSTLVPSAPQHSGHSMQAPHHHHQSFSSAPAPSAFRPVPSMSSMAPRPMAPASASARPVERSVDRPVERSFDRPVERSFDRPVERSFDRPVERSFDRPVERTVPALSVAPVATPVQPVAAAPVAAAPVAAMSIAAAPVQSIAQQAAAQQVPMTSAAARFAVAPPPPIIKPRPEDTAVPKPVEKRADQIFTF